LYNFLNKTPDPAVPVVIEMFSICQ